MRIKRHFFALGALLFVIICATLLANTMPLELFDNREADIKYYVITMGNEERMKNIEENRAKIQSNIEIFDAVNGSKLDLDKIEGPAVDPSFKSDTKIRRGEIGCYLSHWNLYKKIETDGDYNGYTVIFEDDFEIFGQDFEKKLVETIEQMAKYEYDILYMHILSENPGEPFIENVCRLDQTMNFYGTAAYVVKNKNVSRIIKEVSNMDRPIDHKILEAVHNNRIVAYTFCPLATKLKGYKSTIQE